VRKIIYHDKCRIESLNRVHPKNHQKRAVAFPLMMLATKADLSGHPQVLKDKRQGPVREWVACPQSSFAILLPKRSKLNEPSTSQMG